MSSAHLNSMCSRENLLSHCQFEEILIEFSKGILTLLPKWQVRMEMFLCGCVSELEKIESWVMVEGLVILVRFASDLNRCRSLDGRLTKLSSSNEVKYFVKLVTRVRLLVLLIVLHVWVISTKDRKSISRLKSWSEHRWIASRSNTYRSTQSPFLYYGIAL